MTKRTNRVAWGLVATVAVTGVVLVAHSQRRLPEPKRSSALSEPRRVEAGGVMDPRLVKLLKPMTRRPGTSEATLKRLRNYVGADLPADYREFLRWSNGVWGVMPTPRQQVAELGGTGPEGSLHSAEEAIEYTQIWTGRSGYLWLGAFNDSSQHLLLDTRSGDPTSMSYLRVDHTWSEDDAEWNDLWSQRLKPYRTMSFYDLLHHLAAHEVYLSADLRGRDLRRAELSYVYFVEAPLAGADLAGANLREAVLIDNDLAGTNLAGADLREAMLTGTDLSGANLTGAQFTRAVYDRKTRWPQGFDARRHGAVRYEELR